MNKKTVKDINLSGKRVLVRVDYNVSLDKSFRISDLTRVEQSLPTLRYLLEQNCTLILMSHLGQPEGKPDPKYSLKKLVAVLEKSLGKKVHFVTDYLSVKGQNQVKSFGRGEIILLENLRFHKGEEANDSIFAKKLACLGETFVNDGFGVCHRKHASVVEIAKYLPAVAGLLLAKEVESIERIIQNPQKPVVSVLGGAKTKTKIKLITKLLQISQRVLLGGCLANTFLKAKDVDVGQSKVDEDALREAQKILKTFAGGRLTLPRDVVWENLQISPICPISQIGRLRILDIGPQTCREYAQVISQAKTIIWNGPMGMAENPKFAKGTKEIYKAISVNHEAVSLVGGGDTIASLPDQEHLKGITHLSTGGGAMLEFIEKGTLPGIEALENK